MVGDGTTEDSARLAPLYVFVVVVIQGTKIPVRCWRLVATMLHRVYHISRQPNEATTHLSRWIRANKLYVDIVQFGDRWPSLTSSHPLETSILPNLPTPKTRRELEMLATLFDSDHARRLADILVQAVASV